MRFFTLSSLAIFFGASISSASAATVKASSCMSPAVQTAVNSAVDGDTVLIPAGNCDWGSSTLTVPGGVYLRGEGKDVTVIHSSSLANQTLVNFDCANGRIATFSDITLAGKGDPTIWDQGLTLSNGCKSFRVFNSIFTDFVNQGISVYGDSNGVIFSNDFINNFRAGQTGGVTGYGVVVYADGTWPALELGTANAVFVEDNYFYGNRHAIASNNGSRYVLRHNTLIATTAVGNYAMVDAHGLGSWPRGSRSWEIYDNTFSTDLSNERNAVGIRGGDGVIFNNVIVDPSRISYMIELWIEGGPLAYPAPEQMTSGYFWNNTPGWEAHAKINPNAVGNYVEGRDYFQYARPGYTPYTYPHPLTVASTTPPIVDTTPPIVNITQPAAGAFVRGKVTISIIASDNMEVTQLTLYLYIDDQLTGVGNGGGSLSYIWNTRKVAHGAHIIKAIAKDAAGNITTASIQVIT